MKSDEFKTKITQIKVTKKRKEWFRGDEVTEISLGIRAYYIYTL